VTIRRVWIGAIVPWVYEICVAVTCGCLRQKCTYPNELRTCPDREETCKARDLVFFITFTLRFQCEFRKLTAEGNGSTPRANCARPSDLEPARINIANRVTANIRVEVEVISVSHQIDRLNPSDLRSVIPGPAAMQLRSRACLLHYSTNVGKVRSLRACLTAPRRSRTLFSSKCLKEISITPDRLDASGP
jgi:hypothetical protein